MTQLKDSDKDALRLLEREVLNFARVWHGYSTFCPDAPQKAEVERRFILKICELKDLEQSLGLLE